MKIEELTAQVAGKCVDRVSFLDKYRVAIHFTDGYMLVVQRARVGVSATLSADDTAATLPPHLRPTLRQRQYLEFIKKYMGRFGISPAESDIQRHFLVSAPSANAMVQTLERRGFITRQPGVGRSIRIVDGI